MAVGGAQVTLDRIGHSYERSGRRLAVLSDISVDVAPGQCLAIVGPSGSGKSTLLNLMMGRLTPSEGKLQLALGSGQPVRRGVVFQEPTLLPWLTAFENVRLPLELEGRLDNADTRVSEILARVGLGSFADYKPGQLSGGMQSRVALARALVTDPELLLLDEPFANLDEATSEDILVDMAELAKASGATVVLITHSLTQAVFLANRILVLARVPGKARGDFTIDIPVPRDRAFLNDPRLHELVHQVRSTLREAVRAG